MKNFQIVKLTIKSNGRFMVSVVPRNDVRSVGAVSHHDASELDLKVERLASQGVVAIKSHSVLVHLGDDRNLTSCELP